MADKKLGKGGGKDRTTAIDDEDITFHRMVAKVKTNTATEF